MRFPLLPVAAALASGIFLERWLFLTEREYLLAASVLFLFATLGWRLSRLAGATAFSLLGIAVCGAFLMAHTEHARPAPTNVEALVNRGAVELNEPVRVRGWISAVEFRDTGDESYLLQLERLEAAQRTLPASGTIRLQHFRYTADEEPVGLHYGDRVEVLARLRRVRGFRNPAGFDREARARREGTLFYAPIRGKELVDVLPGRAGFAPRRASIWLRGRLLERLDRLFPPPADSNALLRAMLLGDRSGLDRRVSDDFQKTGTYHALVVAGLHTAAIAAFLFFVLGRLRLPRPVTTLLCIAGVGGYVALAGGSIPTARAGLMIAIYLLARLAYRERAALNAVAAAALALLLLNPQDLTDAGFQLSFFCVLLVAAVGVPLVERTSAPYRRALLDLPNADVDLRLEPRQAQFRVELRMYAAALGPHVPQWLLLGVVKIALRAWELALVSLSIQVGFVLPMVVYFHRAGWVSVAANMFIVPLVGIVVPLGALMLTVAMISLPAAGLLAIPEAALVETMRAVARWHSSLTLASFRTPDPPGWLGVLFLAACALLATVLMRRRTVAPPVGRAFLPVSAIEISGSAGPVRRSTSSGDELESLSRWQAFAAAALLFVAGVLLTWHPFAADITRGQMEFTSLDVGQGDALVLIAPPGRVLVEDCGGLPTQAVFDTGEQVVSTYLWSRGIQRIDVLAVTHAHQDHVGGFAAVLANFQVGEVWLPPVYSSEAYQKVFSEARARGIPVRMWTAGQSARLGDAGIQFLSPGADYRVTNKASNNDSLVMRVTYGSRSLVLAGDIERKMEARIIESGMPLGADLLKVPHHGSKTSSTDEFLAQVHAPYGIISVAENSPFGHPHQEALDRLAAAHVRVLRTDQQGAVRWVTDGRRVDIRAFAWEKPATRTIDLW